jgi:hypothetical protein
VADRPLHHVGLAAWPDAESCRLYLSVLTSKPQSRDCFAERALACRGISGVSGTRVNGDRSVVVSTDKVSTDKPVFSDDSGARAVVLRWGVWAICLMALLLRQRARADPTHSCPTPRHGSVAAAIARPVGRSGSFAHRGIANPGGSAVDDVPTQPNRHRSERSARPNRHQLEGPAQPHNQARGPNGWPDLGCPKEQANPDCQSHVQR